MRTIAAVLGCLALVGAAAASSALDVVVVPRTTYPPPAGDVSSPGPRLVLVSSRFRSPTSPARPDPGRPAFAPQAFRGEGLQHTIRQGAKVFLTYGGRYLVGANARTRRLVYAFDLVNLARQAPGEWFEDVTFAREAGGVLYVENTHLTYATASNGRNAYVTAIDLASGKVRWRSPALVANARTFVLAGDYIVSGYGFTAEPDFLYLLDRRTGRVVDRLAVASAPERIRLRGDRLYVRTYDRTVVARIVTS